MRKNYHSIQAKLFDDDSEDDDDLFAAVDTSVKDEICFGVQILDSLSKTPGSFLDLVQRLY